MYRRTLHFNVVCIHIMYGLYSFSLKLSPFLYTTSSSTLCCVLCVKMYRRDEWLSLFISRYRSFFQTTRACLTLPYLGYSQNQPQLWFHELCFLVQYHQCQCIFITSNVLWTVRFVDGASLLLQEFLV